jgi:hypothetical protein
VRRSCAVLSSVVMFQIATRQRRQLALNRYYTHNSF